ncbi:hypothetical protein X943_000460 [Babesia divergens]|uniref:F-box domain-containing protein n=1 Tax=Babesia divergens TaxID=32595 RepID=A0AAD9GCL2_BABDI|nr:hypothetical protein X943_000460 [Babesia divergens]
MASLEILVSRCPGMALTVLSEYLDFADFLNLSVTCREIRRSMVSQAHIWIEFYNKRRKPSALIRASPLFSEASGDHCCYKLSMEDDVHTPFESLVELAQRSGVLPCINSSHLNPFLDLAKKSGVYSRRTCIDVDVYKEIRVSSNPVVSEDANVGKPLTIVDKTRLFGYNRHHDFFSIRIMTNVTDETRLSVIGSRWLRSVDCPYCACEKLTRGNFTAPQESDASMGFQTKETSYLSILYSHGWNEVGVSLYEYNENGFSPRSRLTWKVSVSPRDISCFDIFYSSRCRHFSVFVGAHDGRVYMRCHDREETFEVANVPIKSLLAISIGCEWLLCLLAEKYQGYLLRVGDTCDIVKSLDHVSSFDFDQSGGILGYCSDKKCTIMFYNFGSLAAEIGVSKPPSSIMFLKRRSLWVLVIRNYLKLVQAFNYAGSVRIENFKTLNGHTSSITECRHDGWSRLVSVDTGRNVIIWDFIRGVTLVRFPMLSAAPSPSVSNSWYHGCPPTRRKKESVNRRISYSSIYNAKKNFNTPPQPLVSSDSDDIVDHVKKLSLGRTGQTVGPNSRGKACGKHTVFISLSNLCIYYHDLSRIQLMSFK